jgi:hypothetical protein
MASTSNGGARKITNEGDRLFMHDVEVKPVPRYYVGLS